MISFFIWFSLLLDNIFIIVEAPIPEIITVSISLFITSRPLPHLAVILSSRWYFLTFLIPFSKAFSDTSAINTFSVILFLTIYMSKRAWSQPISATLSSKVISPARDFNRLLIFILIHHKVFKFLSSRRMSKFS